MSYTPPAGNAVDFTATGVSYTPPAGNAVDFELSKTLTVSGKLPFGGSVELRLQADLTITGKLAFSGGVSAIAHPVFAIRDSFFFGGAATFETDFELRASGSLPLGGLCSLSAANALYVSEAFSFGGQASFRTPTEIYCSGAFAFGGHASFTLYPSYAIESKTLQGPGMGQTSAAIQVGTGDQGNPGYAEDAHIFSLFPNFEKSWNNQAGYLKKPSIYDSNQLDVWHPRLRLERQTRLLPRVDYSQAVPVESFEQLTGEFIRPMVLSR
jgi:hypothetical protein